MSKSEQNIAVCPGSYDPITNGHLDVIRRAAAIYDKVVVGVVHLSVRKSNYLFSIEDRIEMIEEATSDLGNVVVESFSNLLVEFSREQNARVIVKGLRAISDFEYEFEMHQLNRTLAPDIESVYMMASPQYSFISSSGIKEVAQFGGSVAEMVPAHVAMRLEEAMSR